MDTLLDDADWNEAGLTARLAAAGLSEPARSLGVRALARMAHHASAPQDRAALADLLPLLLSELGNTPRPEAVLVNLERLAAAQGLPALCRQLAAEPRALQVLAVLFSGSQFLTETLLRSPDALPKVLADVQGISTPRSAAALRDEAVDAAAAGGADALRRWQRLELLRIGAADLLDQFDLTTATRRLSDLADALVGASLGLACCADPHVEPSGLAVLALGKLGGRELNYSSDIDLLFICADSAAEQQRRTAQRLIDVLAGVTAEGFLYRVDMRLRPWGQSGPLVSTLSGYLAYLEQHARLWERQALLKVRLVAGDPALGEAFLRRCTALLYHDSAETVRTAVRAMKERTESYLREKGRAWGEVKLGEGSIRDVEFVTQALQLVHGERQPEIRSRNTLDALARLQRFGLLPPEDGRVLADGYVFLRTVEHHLQILHAHQRASLPRDPESLAELARRLGFAGPDAAGHFLTRYARHGAAVRAIYLRYLGSSELPAAPEKPAAPEVRRHLERMDPSYQNTFSPADIQRHTAMAQQLDDDHLSGVQAAALEDGGWRVTVVAYDYPGELTLLCGLMFASGLDIQDGDVFTYEAEPGPQARRKIVDVFNVRLVRGDSSEDLWARYPADLEALLRLMQAGRSEEARLTLAKRVAEALQDLQDRHTSGNPLYPILIEIDNEISSGYSVLRIQSQDTPGFLYELTSALAFNNIYIARMQIESAGQRVSDILWVTDERGGKITSPARQRELRAATVLIKHFTHLLPLSPDPAAALLHFRQFIATLFQHPDWPDELASLERQEVLNALAQVLGVSNFLWDDFLRMQHANLFPVVRDIDALATAKDRPRLQSELETVLRAREDTPWRDVLNAFKDREMFRVDMRHILGHTTEFWDFAVELSDLAEVVVNSAFHLTGEDLRRVYGTPRLADGSPAQMAVLALGKFGGQELGFASDIELMFVYSGNGHTDGAQALSTAEFFEKLVENFSAAVRSRREGIFHIDLQLRPYGKAGSLAVSLESFRRYFVPGGPAWPYERQALVRLRAVAGDANLGQQVMELRDAFIYTGGTFDVIAMRAMRERQLRHLVSGGTFNAKYSPGGLVDLEYLVQGLQIRHGEHNPAVRSTNIRVALAALAQAGILSAADFTLLHKAHTFFRWLIDGLRMVAGNAQDLTVPPADSEAFAYLARRLRYPDARPLQADLALYSGAVQDAARRLLLP